MSIEWLEELETRVREATERLGELRDENRGLQDCIGELEIKLAAATPEPAEAREENEALRQRIIALEREREEVRGRVERLTRHLEGLL